MALRLAVLLWIAAGPLWAGTIETLSATYGPYDVNISFETTLTGPALDSLGSDDITPTVSNFFETNSIGTGPATALDLIVSTDSQGNITAFQITDTLGQVVTNTYDFGYLSTVLYTAPLVDIRGEPLTLSTSTNGTAIIGDYGSGSCTWNSSTGALVTDADLGGCEATAASSPFYEPQSVPGTGTLTAAPEPEAYGMVLAGLFVLVLSRVNPACRRTTGERES